MNFVDKDGTNEVYIPAHPWKATLKKGVHKVHDMSRKRIVCIKNIPWQYICVFLHQCSLSYKQLVKSYYLLTGCKGRTVKY